MREERALFRMSHTPAFCVFSFFPLQHFSLTDQMSPLWLPPQFPPTTSLLTFSMSLQTSTRVLSRAHTAHRGRKFLLLVMHGKFAGFAPQRGSPRAGEGTWRGKVPVPFPSTDTTHLALSRAWHYRTYCMLGLCSARPLCIPAGHSTH